MPTLISLSVTPTSAALLAESGTRDKGTETITANADAITVCFRRRQHRKASRLSMGQFPSSRKAERTLDYWKG
jgi:hypothetical protein